MSPVAPLKRLLIFYNIGNWFAINWRNLRSLKRLLAQRGRRPTVLMALAEPGHPYYESWRAGIEANGWAVIWLPRAWELLFSHQLCLYLALCPFVRAVHLIDVDLRNLFGYHHAARRFLSFAALRLVIGWPKLLGKHVVYSFGNVVPHEDNSPYEYRRHRLICSLVDDVISLSPALTKELIRAGIPERHIWPVEHANISDYFKVPDGWPPFRQAYGIAADAVLILCIGTIRPYKGIEVAVAGFKRSRNARLRLLIAGKPAAGYQEAQVAALASGDERILLGPLRHLSNAEMGWMFQDADFCILPYQDIGHSGLICQSLGAGVPVIASRVGCIPDYLEGGAGLLFTPGDAGDLARVLDTQLNAFDRDRARTIGLRIMGQRTPERIGKRLVAVYAYVDGQPSPETNWLF